MRFYHKNMPVDPVIADRGNSVILYSSKNRVSLADNSVNLSEVIVAGQSFFIETHQIKPGLDIGVLVLNNVPFEFLLKKVGPSQESAIVLNPKKRKVDIDHKDVALYYLGQTEATEAKEPVNNIPPNLKKYETNALVYEAITPLSASLVLNVTRQNALMEKSLTTLHSTFQNHKTYLESKLKEGFSGFQKIHNEALQKAFKDILTTTEKRTEDWFTHYSKATDKLLSGRLEKYAKGVITESVKEQQTALQAEFNGFFETLRRDASQWINERVQELQSHSYQLLLEKQNESTQEVEVRLDAIKQVLETRTARLDEQIGEKLDRTLKDLQRHIDTSTGEFKKITEAAVSELDQHVEGTRAAYAQLGAVKQGLETRATQLDEQARDLQKHIDISTGEFKKITEAAASKLDQRIEENIEKKGLNARVKKYVDEQVAQIRNLALRLVESGGGTVAQQFANGGTMNGNLTVNGQVSARSLSASYIYTDHLTALSSTFTVIDIKYYELSGFNVTGDVSIDGNVSIYHQLTASSGYIPTLSADSLQFNVSAGITPQEGVLAWNLAEDTVNIGMHGGATLPVGQKEVVRVIADANIKNGQAVYASGAQGQGSGRIRVNLFSASSASSVDELYFLGVATQDIASGAEGYAATLGKIFDVKVADTRASNDPAYPSAGSVGWEIGTVLYVSEVDAGKYTSVPPIAPNRTMPVVLVISKNGNNRTFFARAEHGYHLDEIHDVKYTLPLQNNQVLAWDGDDQTWENKSLSAIMSSSPQVYTGNTSPEGSVTAARGSIYTDYSNGSIYVKSTDGGSTGWI